MARGNASAAVDFRFGGGCFRMMIKTAVSRLFLGFYAVFAPAKIAKRR